MAEYWKSQPRHFCEFCKCWIADNKPSRDFHEKGKRHKENVQKKIDLVRKKSEKDAVSKQEMSDSLREMEEAALAAFKDDIRKDPSLANQYGVSLPEKYTIVDKDESTSEPAATSEPPKKKLENKTKSEDKDVADQWFEATTPEGYTYYWHGITGESKWIKPEDTTEERTDEPSDTKPDVKTKPKEAPQHKTQDKKPVKRKAEEIPLPAEESPEEDTGLQFGPAPKAQQYGQWETVKTEEEPLPELDLPEKKEEAAAAIVITQEPKIKFREKKVTSLGDEMVGFKKRKNVKKAFQFRKRDDS